MKFGNIVSKGWKLKVIKLQALSLNEKKVIKKHLTGSGVNLPPMAWKKTDSSFER